MSGSNVQLSAPQSRQAPQQSRSNIALSFLPVKVDDFTFSIYRRRLHSDQESVPGTRELPERDNNGVQTERQRYEVSLEPEQGMEKFTVRAWTNIGLTDEVLYRALIARVQQADVRQFVELPENRFIRKVDFVLKRHGDVREVMSLRAYGLRAVQRFGFLCHFGLRVPRDSKLPERRRLELSLTHKNGRMNEDFYLDQHQKIEAFLTAYFSEIATLELHDGTRVSLDPKLSVLPAFPLNRRTYVFGGGNEGRNQFFGLRDHGPYQGTDGNGRLVFMFEAPDREKSQQLFRALRGDTYSTFPGLESLFGTAIGRQNVSGTVVDGWSNGGLRQVCAALKVQFPDERIVPVAVVPMSKHVSDEETRTYYAAKHACLSEGLSSQFVDRKLMDDRNALKWSISNIGLALFAKMGGIPWRVKPSTDRCLIVGVGQAHRIVNKKVERYVAYTVLTDSTGGYERIKVLGNSANQNEYLTSLRANLREVLLSHADRYDSFVLHVTFSMRRREVEAIRDLLRELKGTEAAGHEFIAIKFNDKNDFLGFSVTHNSRVPHEGTVTRLSDREFLMWFSGLGLDDSKVPRKPERPVHLRVLYPDVPLSESDVKRVLQDAMNIAGANWRGFSAKSMPISVYYAKIIADYYGHFCEANLPEVDLETACPWFL